LESRSAEFTLPHYEYTRCLLLDLTLEIWDDEYLVVGTKHRKQLLMITSHPRLLQIFNQTLGGGGVDLAVEQMRRALAIKCEFRE
jgi:hypothetical protein